MANSGSARFVGWVLLVATTAFVGIRASSRIDGNTPVPSVPRPVPQAQGPISQLQELAGVSPAQGSTVCPRPKVMIVLRLSDALRTRGTFDPARVRLLLDGTDVTRKSVILGTQDYPQRSASLMYAPEKPLIRGLHRGLFRFASTRGPQTYAWSFTVAPIPCQ